MLSPIEIVAVALAIPSLIAFLLSQVDLWQRKEYRLDRLRASLAEPAFRNRLYPYFLALAALIFNQPLISILVIFAFNLWRIAARGLFRPTFTFKAIFVIALTALLTLVDASPPFFLTAMTVDQLAISLLLIPFFVFFSVVVSNFVGSFRKQQIISQARKLRASRPNLKVIGITGSYGKTSAKHFLSQLLPEAVVSQEHRNDLFPIAQDILKQLKSDTTTYIVEMGAYKRGEIAALAKLAQPTIGVITAIGNQHLATFGSQANIVKAKWELIDALPADGTAVLNADDARSKRVAGLGGPPTSARSEARTSGGGKSPTGPAMKQLLFSAQEPTDIFADQININPTSISCNLHIKEDSQAVTIPLAGEGTLSSVLAAVAAAHAAGVSSADIFSRVQQLKPYPKTMQIKSGPAESTIIDDSYSANEAGVIAAIKHLDTFDSKDKRIIIVPIIELGSEAKAAHARISKALKTSGASVHYYSPSKSNPYKVTFSITDPKAVVESAMRPQITSDTVFLLEGRLPKSIINALTSR